MAKKKHTQSKAEFSKRRIQIFPRQALFELIIGDAIDKGMVFDKSGKPNKTQLVCDIASDNYFGNKYNDSQRMRLREIAREYLNAVK